MKTTNRFDAKRLGAVCVGAAVLAASLVSAGEAEASGPVTPTYKGTVGGLLLGGEVIVIPMGAAGVNRGWPYFVFGGLGMVGGAVGGYFLDTRSNSTGAAEPSLYMLAGGMALVIPAVVLALNATAYRPPDGADRVEPANNNPAREPPSPVGPPSTGTPPPGVPPMSGPPPAVGPGASYRYQSHYRSALAGMPHIPTSLFDLYDAKLGLGVPGPVVRPLYTQAEIARFGVTQGTEVQVPVFKAVF